MHFPSSGAPIGPKHLGRLSTEAGKGATWETVKGLRITISGHWVAWLRGYDLQQSHLGDHCFALHPDLLCLKGPNPRFCLSAWNPGTALRCSAVPQKQRCL